MLCGARSLYAIGQWGRERLEQLGLPPGRSPCLARLHRVFKGLDVDVFEAVAGAWPRAG